MPVDENKIESRLRSLSESIALMHIDFAGFFEEYSLKESIDSIMLNYESGSYTSAIKSCSEQSFLIKNNKLILGTWQGIYLFEHRIEQQIRKVFLHIIGEK